MDFLSENCLMQSFYHRSSVFRFMYSIGGVHWRTFRRFRLLEDVVPDIMIDLRYFGNDNFIGGPVGGYVEPRRILTLKTAEALKKVQLN